MIETVELSDNDIKRVIITMFKYLKENMVIRKKEHLEINI